MLMSLCRLRDEGVSRGPGGPPHQLKPGMTREKAQAGLQPLFHQILDMEVQQKEFAKASPFVKREFLKMSLELMPGATGRSYLRDSYSKPLLALMAIVALVLL